VPTLVTLELATFAVATAFAVHISRGGVAGAVAGVTFNSTLIILSSALASNSTNSGLWLTRLFQFALACTFAIGMMSLVWTAKPDIQRR
jgi:hypothetical protein